jgi:hypothetical protein
LPSPEDRFWKYVQKTETCWNWTGSKLPTGYAPFCISGRGKNRVRTYAHRFAYNLLVGEVPEGLDLDHVCRNRACVNPAHLEPVTRSENMLRAAPYRPAHYDMGPTCPNGHDRAQWGFYNTYGRQVCRLCHRAAVKRSKAKQQLCLTVGGD